MKSGFFNFIFCMFFGVSLVAKADLFDTLGLEHFGDKNTGEIAVNKAIALAAHIFISHQNPIVYVFLKRIARVESDLGRHSGTFRQGYFGGIWQVDRIGFDETKNLRSHPGLSRLHDEIKQRFSWGGLPGVDWSKTSWEDCTIPAYSCVAARLYLATISEAIPQSLEGQANYWKKYYNTAAGAGTAQHFINANRGFKDEL